MSVSGPHPRAFVRNPIPVPCPDCGLPTPIVVGSLLGTIHVLPVDADRVREVLLSYRNQWKQQLEMHQHRRRVGQRTTTMTVNRTGLVCSRCAYVRPTLFWLDIGSRLPDPLCLGCARHHVWKDLEGDDGLRIDLRVFLMHGSKVTLLRTTKVLIEIDDEGPTRSAGTLF